MPADCHGKGQVMPHSSCDSQKETFVLQSLDKLEIVYPPQLGEVSRLCLEFTYMHWNCAWNPLVQLSILYKGSLI